MPGADRKPKTLYDKVLDAHIVNEQEDGTLLIYIGMMRKRWISIRDSTLTFTRQTSGPRSDLSSTSERFASRQVVLFRR
jgi:hypothetical protein